MDMILTSRRDDVCTVTLNRPDKRNALSVALIEQLGRTIETLSADRTMRVLVIRGAGRAFCAGLDLGELAEPDKLAAASDARFAMPVARLGLAAPYPLTLKLIETIGAAATKELLFTGDFITADRALSLGMITRLAQPADLEATASALAETIAANAPMALETMKQYVLRARHMFTTIPHDDLAALERRLRDSADVREGLRARRERRKPVFRGE